ncbi:MAG: hypothetical protein K2Q06_05085, partial [Parvularculaceae bacterium]|nr:hypothetical protein [Parvularculaceae bacterium]
MFWRSVVTAAAFALATGAAAPSPSVDYVVEPVFKSGALDALKVTLRFAGDADGETALELPNSWGGEDELDGAVHDLSVRGAAMRAGDKPFLRILSHKPNARLVATYLLRQERPGAPDAAKGDNYRPFIQPGFFHVLGWTSYARPQRDLLSTTARLSFRGAPQGWRFASDTEHHAATTLHAVLESVAVGGDFDILTPKNGAAPGLRVAIRGDKWGFDKQDFADRVGAILSAEREYWGDPDEPYLVTLLPLAAPDAG